MITAVDTSILLDVFGADAKFGPSSKGALQECMREGKLIACEVVWAEVAGFFPSPRHLKEAMALLNVGFDSLSLDPSIDAGVAWKTYRAKGGSRARMVPDFLIGAHVLSEADRLLSRDRGFYRAYFRRLKVMDPSRNMR